MRKDWEDCRNVFDTVAELYDEVRESYPKELVQDIMSEFQKPDSIKILEIGSGTGKATTLFAEYESEI